MCAESATLRFVVLYHDQIPGPHFDLMFEIKPGGELATWRSPRWPIGSETPLTALHPHRPAYLQFEGDLSENRGRVRRIAAGTFRRDEEGAIVFLDPGGLASIKIHSQADGTWLANVA
jgi:hypothetical protein